MKKFLLLAVCVCLLMISCMTITPGGRVYTIRNMMTPDGLLVEQVKNVSSSSVKNELAAYSYSYYSSYDGKYRTVHGNCSSLFYCYLGKQLINGEVSGKFVQFDCFSPISPSRGSNQIPLLCETIYISIDGVPYVLRNGVSSYEKEIKYADMYRTEDYSFDCYHAIARYEIDDDLAEALATATSIQIQYFNDPMRTGVDGVLITIAPEVVESIRTYITESLSVAAEYDSIYQI